MSRQSDALARRYAPLVTVVRGAGAVHRAGFEPRDRLDVVVEDAPAEVDEALRAGGAAHLAAIRERFPGVHDGPVLALHRLEPGLLRVRPAGYFDRIATGAAVALDDALRERAEALAVGDPLRRGDGRAAGVGVTTVATVRSGRTRSLVLGRRASGLPVGAGRWHVVPSGMLEPSHDPLLDTARRELREELACEAPASAFALLGIGWDLARLQPDVCLRVDLDVDAEEIGASPSAEHEELALWPLDDLDALWRAHPPGTLTPPAAAAIALL